MLAYDWLMMHLLSASLFRLLYDFDNEFQFKTALYYFCNVQLVVCHHLFWLCACTMYLPHFGTRPGSKSSLLWLSKITE